MKYTTILLITLSSLSFAGFYISYDAQATAELEIFGISVDNDYDTGALTLGYEDDALNVIQTLPENILIGASFDVLKMKFGNDDSDVGDGFLNIYGKYTYVINDNFTAWGSLGYNLPMGDIDEADGGMLYGFGVIMDNGFGASYIVQNITFTEEDINVDATISRISVSYSF